MTNCSTAKPWAIVLAGGAGRRLAGATRRLEGRAMPKQFCRFGHSRSLLQETLDRIRCWVPEERTVLVVTRPWRAMARSQVRRGAPITILEQPTDRGTMAGLLLPLAYVNRKDPAATVIVLPSDHGIRCRATFQEGLREACRRVQTNRARMVLGGVQATSANPDYGWIVPSERRTAAGGWALSPVRRFVEKPSRAEAAALLAERALWSTFILVASSATLMRLFETQVPEATHAFDTWASLGGERADDVLEHTYEQLETMDFSTAFLQRARELDVLRWPETLGWTDLGTPERLSAWLRFPDSMRRLSGAALVESPQTLEASNQKGAGSCHARRKV